MPYLTLPSFWWRYPLLYTQPVTKTCECPVCRASVLTKRGLDDTSAFLNALVSSRPRFVRMAWICLVTRHFLAVSARIRHLSNLAIKLNDSEKGDPQTRTPAGAFELV